MSCNIICHHVPFTAYGYGRACSQVKKGLIPSPLVPSPFSSSNSTVSPTLTQLPMNSTSPSSHSANLNASPGGPVVSKPPNSEVSSPSAPSSSIATPPV